MFDNIFTNWIIILVFFIIVLLPSSPIEQFRNSSSNIKIWCYKELPRPLHEIVSLPYFDLCHDTHNNKGSNFDIVVLTPDTLHKYIVPLDPEIAIIYSKRMRYIQYAILSKYGGLWLPPAALALQSMNEVEFQLRDRGICFFRDTVSGLISDEIIGSSRPNHPLITEEYLNIQRDIYHPHILSGGEDICSGSEKWTLLQKQFEFPEFPITSNTSLILGNEPLSRDIYNNLFLLPSRDFLWRNHSANFLINASRKQISKACSRLTSMIS